MEDRILLRGTLATIFVLLLALGAVAIQAIRSGPEPEPCPETLGCISIKSCVGGSPMPSKMDEIREYLRSPQSGVMCCASCTKDAMMKSSRGLLAALKWEGSTNPEWDGRKDMIDRIHAAMFEEGNAALAEVGEDLSPAPRHDEKYHKFMDKLNAPEDDPS